jgi:hypothetical protein
MREQGTDNAMHRFGTVLAAGVLAGMLGGAGAATADVKASPDAVIYNGEYPGWPWIDKTPGGTLLTVWREGTEHMYSSTGRVMLSQSTNEGKSWSPARTIIDAPQIDDRNAAITAFSNTDWMVCYNTYTSNDVSQTMTVRTLDGGLTWSAPKAVSSLDARTRAAPIRLSTGELVLPYYLAPGNQSLAARSIDNGQTWSTVALPNFSGFVGDEWSIVEMPNHSLAGIIRNSGNNDGWFYTTKSVDKGLSWTTPVKTNLRDSAWPSPAQIFIRDGKPWVLYDDARFTSIALVTTDDPNLVTWNVDEKETVIQYRADGGRVSDGGYPCSVALSGDRLYVVDYVIDGGAGSIYGYSVSLPEPSSLMLLGICAMGYSVMYFINRSRQRAFSLAQAFTPGNGSRPQQTHFSIFAPFGGENGKMEGGRNCRPQV